MFVEKIGADDVVQIALAIIDGIADRNNHRLAYEVEQGLPDSRMVSLFQFFDEIKEGSFFRERYTHGAGRVLRRQQHVSIRLD